MSRRDRIVQQMRRFSINVTTTSGATFSGVLLEADERSLLLTQAAQVSPDGTRIPADGQIVVPRADVAYIQQT